MKKTSEQIFEFVKEQTRLEPFHLAALEQHGGFTSDIEGFMACNYEKSIYDWAHDHNNASGGIGGFIYYNETEPFAKKWLLNMIRYLEDSMGKSEVNALNERAVESGNFLNLWAWFAIEDCALQIARIDESEWEMFIAGE